jgi:hypothetical protein
VSRFYSNENFPLPVVEELRKLGHDVLTIQETGKADEACPDKEVLRFAKETAGSSHAEPPAFYPVAPERFGSLRRDSL